MRLIAAPLPGDVAIAQYFCGASFYLSNQLVVMREKDESANMARARQFIETHQAEPLSLGRVARSANISRHYFCKMFKKATKVNFVDLPLPRASGESQGPFAHLQFARERSCLRQRISIHDELQSRFPANCRAISHAIPQIASQAAAFIKSG